MTRIQTFTGRQFDLADPQRGSIDVVDMAHALSLLCRFNGHVRQHYSVAQHCVIVSHLVPSEHAYAGLLHDRRPSAGPVREGGVSEVRVPHTVRV